MILKSPDFTVVNTPGIGNQNISIVQGDNRLKAVRGPLKRLRQRIHECSAILSKRALAFRCFSCSSAAGSESDRKSTRLNSSHVAISYAVFCLKKKPYKTTDLSSF